jgi:hypothetical protein
MTWTVQQDGIWVSGYYRINRAITNYEVWHTHSKAFRLIGKTSTLGGAKTIAERDQEDHR